MGHLSETQASVQLLPKDVTANSLVRRAIQNVRQKEPVPEETSDDFAMVQPPAELWVRVKALFGHGSTYSAQICRAYGFDPNEGWMP